MLPAGQIPDAIVLADKTWHQGVVGIVASRMAEEYCCPTFLICLDGEHGKASSRSFGGFNLFASLLNLQSCTGSNTLFPAGTDNVGILPFLGSHGKDDGFGMCHCLFIQLYIFQICATGHAT